jgi:hypothetical protein
VGDEVGHRAVRLVAEAGEHGDAGAGDRLGDATAVERCEVALRAAAAHQHDAVEGPCGERAECRGHLALGRRSLHRRMHEQHLETVPAVAQAGEEVVVGGAVVRGDETDA